MISQRRLPTLITLLVFPLFMPACTQSRIASPQPATPSPSLPAPVITFLQSPQAPVTPSQVAPVTTNPTTQSVPTTTTNPAIISQYTLNATLDYWQHHLTVDEQIDYINTSTDTLQELLLLVEPVNYPGVFQLKTLTWGNGETIADISWNNSQIHLPLPKPLEPGKRVLIKLSYELLLPSPVPSPTTRPVPFGYTQRQVNLVDWYPYVPPYVPGQGWLAHPPGYFGEHLVYDIANFQVNIKFNEIPFTPATNTAPGFAIAASASPQIDGEGYHYHLENARNFAWSASHAYQVVSTTVGTATIYGYAFPIHVLAGSAALKTTAESLSLYSDLFGLYPHDSMSVVEADFLDGMEYDGLYFLSNGFYNLYDGTSANYLTAIAAHETAHQWWYGLIGNDQAMDPWLDEALATYCERLYFEKYHPDALAWWWSYRVNYYEPAGKINGSIYSYTAATKEAYRSYRDAVYLNGAVFLEELRKTIGDKAFFAFLKEYTQQYTHKIATPQDFITLLKAQVSPTDITPLLNKYFNQP